MNENQSLKDAVLEQTLKPLGDKIAELTINLELAYSENRLLRQELESLKENDKDNNAK